MWVFNLQDSSVCYGRQGQAGKRWGFRGRQVLQSECEAPSFAALGQTLLAIGYVNGGVVANGGCKVPSNVNEMGIEEAHDIFKEHPVGPYES